MFTYAYNPADQIVVREGDNDLYAHTGLGGGTALSPADGLNRMMALGATALTYDARGNQTTDGSNAFGFSSENLLTAVGPTPLVYDPLETRGHKHGDTVLKHGDTVLISSDKLIG